MTKMLPHPDWESGRALTPCPRFAPVPMLWPVYGFHDGMSDPVATFFDYDAAVDLVLHSDRNLYIGVPSYDRRAT